MLKRKRRYICTRCGWRYALRGGEMFPPLASIPVCPSGGGHLCVRDTDHTGMRLARMVDAS